MKHIGSIGAVLGLAGFLAGGQARAAAIGVPEQDSLEIAMSTGGETTYAAPSIAYYNPAGMVLIKGTQVENDITLYDIQSKVDASLIPDANVAPGPGFNGHATNFVKSTFVATAFAVFSLPHGIKIGFSITEPNGGRVKYPANFVGDYEGSEALLTNIQGGLNVAVPVTDHLSIGGGPVISYFQSIVGVRQNLPIGTAATPGGDGVIGQFSGRGYAFGYNIGAMYQFDADTRVGVDYRSRINHRLKGVERNDEGGLPALLGALVPPEITTASDNFVFPQTVSFGAFHQINAQLAVMANAQWENWHTYQTLFVSDPTTAQAFLVGPHISPVVTNFHFRDAWTVGVAGTYQPVQLPKLTLIGGLGYDETPVPSGSYRVTGLPDNNRVMLGIGSKYQLTPRTVLQSAYAHYFIQDAGIRDQRLDANGQTAYAGTLVGQYKISADVFSLGLISQF